MSNDSTKEKPAAPNHADPASKKKPKGNTDPGLVGNRGVTEPSPNSLKKEGKKKGKRKRKPKPTAEYGDIKKHSAQGKARWSEDGMTRESEHEHPRARTNVENMTKDPVTGISPYDKNAYRRSATLTIPRDMALEKTKMDMALQRRILNGTATADDMSIQGDIERTQRARDITKAKRTAAGLTTHSLDVITDLKIRQAAHYQQGELFEVGKSQKIVGLSDADLDEAFDNWETPKTDSQSPSRDKAVDKSRGVEKTASQERKDTHRRNKRRRDNRKNRRQKERLERTKQKQKKPKPKVKMKVNGSKTDALRSSGKSKFSFRVKINPKVRAIGGFVLTIGLDLFLGWLDGRRFSRAIQEQLKKNSDEFSKVINAVATQEDFVKFRTGDKLEIGYQLYLKIELSVQRTCSDGGCSNSGWIKDIKFKRVTFSRTKEADFSPDPKSAKGWDAEGSFSGAIAVIYQPIFEQGLPVKRATEDAADEKLIEFSQTFITRKIRGLSDPTRDYFHDFHQYSKLFPKSQAGMTFLGFASNDYLSDITDVEFGMKSPWIMMDPPHNLRFDEVIKKVRWSFASKVMFIKEFYELVISLREDDAIEYLDRYDMYFRELDTGYTKCNVSCHRMVGDRRIIHRLTAEEIRRRRGIFKIMRR